MTFVINLIVDSFLFLNYALFSPVPWFTTGTSETHQIIKDISELGNRHALLLEILPNQEEFVVLETNLTREFDDFLASLEPFRQTTLLSRSDCAVINTKVDVVFNELSASLYGDFEAALAQNERILLGQGAGLDQLMSCLQQLMWTESSYVLYDISRLISALPVFDEHPLLDELDALIPRDSTNPKWAQITKENFLPKLLPRPLVYPELSGQSKALYAEEMQIVKQLLQAHLARFK